MIFALDSNIISNILKKDADTIARYRCEIKKGNEFIIPPIVFYEIERGLLAKNLLAKRRAFIEFCKDVEIGEFNTEVWRKAAEIYSALSKQGKPIGTVFDGDVFVAAYCVVYGYTLVSNNKKHFIRINDLQMEDWIGKK